MSDAKRIPHAQAQRLAEELRGLLMDGCERIEIAGSIRRQSPDVKDIELVTIARSRPALFPDMPGDDMLNEIIRLRVRERKLSWRGRGGGAVPEPENLDGRRKYDLFFRDMPVDLFNVRPPAEWGAIFAIRTGPAEYSQALVTRVQSRGYRCHEGRLISTLPSTVGEARPTPEEKDFIEACGFPYESPHLRQARVLPARLPRR